MPEVKSIDAALEAAVEHPAVPAEATEWKMYMEVK